MVVLSRFLWALIQSLHMTLNILRPTCRSVPAVAILFGLVVGCSEDAGVESVVPTDESIKTRDESKVTIEPGTWDDVLAIVEQNRGKVVVVDLWSTSCVPCIAELPRLAELHESLADDVVCVSFNVDYVGIASKPPEFYLDRVRKVLERSNATYSNLLCTTEADVLFETLDLPSIPAVYVYSRDGMLAKRFDASLYDEESDDDEAFNYEDDVEPLVRSLVKSGS